MFIDAEAEATILQEGDLELKKCACLDCNARGITCNGWQYRFANNPEWHCDVGGNALEEYYRERMG